MTSALKKYNILCKDNTCNSIFTDQEQIFALTPSSRISSMRTLRFPRLSSPRLPEMTEAKERVKSKAMVRSKLAIRQRNQRAKKSGRRKIWRTVKPTPRRLTTRTIIGASLTRLGRSTALRNASSNKKNSRPVISAPTPSCWQTLWDHLVKDQR